MEKVTAEARQRPDLSNPQVREIYVKDLAEKARKAKAEARAWAAARGIPVRYDDGTNLIELMAVVDSMPMYYKINNVNAAISTAADLVRNTLPYDVNGAGFTVGVWDGGSVLSTHQEFGGRVTVMDGASSNWHSTHVGGTIGAAGVVASALGMSPSVEIDSYEWTSDASEMAGRGASYPNEPDKIYISSHSYGFISGWEHAYSPPRWYGQWGYRESDQFGQYDSYAVEWDQVCYNFPYYLPFKSAGNDRNDDAPAEGETFEYFFVATWQSKQYDSTTDPYDDGWDNGGFDTIGLVGNAKNIMTVGAVDDAVSGGQRDPNEGTIADFSSWGPTDDGRIKPDIVANGVSLYSTDNDNDSDYTTASGTSMSAPNASGSAMLLVHYYSLLHPGQAMLSSTLKGLIIHTADDLGNPGPDYSFGWGLMNTKTAADVIAENRLKESLLDTANPNDVYELYSDGNSPIRMTICWTDPPASAISSYDNPSPRLINDLDMNVTGPNAVVYYPYILDAANPSNTATTGDNTLDNVEQIYISSPAEAGIYTVRISYKGTLANGRQDYSFISSIPFDTVVPVAENSSASAEPGVPVTIELYGDDDGFPNPPAALEYIIMSQPHYGNISDPCAGEISSSDIPYALADFGNKIIYTPIDCYSGQDSFDFKVNDGGSEPNGGDSNIATVTVTIEPLPQVIYETDFEEGLPSGWSIIDGGSSTHTWTSDNPKNRSNPNWTGIFMIVDSEDAKNRFMNEELITNSIDCSGQYGVKLKFKHCFQYNSNTWHEIGDVDVRIDNGDWQNVARYQDDSFEGQVELDISAIADDQNDVRIRWHYYNARNDLYWGIDDVQLIVEQIIEPPAGDFEPDCDVDLHDFSLLASAWMSEPDSPDWNPLFDISEPNDNIINLLDLDILAENWLLVP